MSELNNMALSLVNRIDLTLLNEKEVTEVMFIKDIMNRFPGILLSVLSKVDLSSQTVTVRNEALFITEECVRLLNPTDNKVNR